MTEQKITSREIDPITARCMAEAVPLVPDVWQQIRADVLQIEQTHFGENAFTEEAFLKAFKSPLNAFVVTRDTATGRVVGYTFTLPTSQVYREEFHPEREILPNSAYIESTALHPDYMGHKLTGPMIQVLEDELINKGYEYLERDAAVANNYAANIMKRYGDRILESQLHSAPEGDQYYFKIKLGK